MRSSAVHAGLLGEQHGAGAVGVIGADVEALVATQLLEAHPDVGLDVLQQVPQVNWAVDVRQGAGDQDAAVHRQRCGKGWRNIPQAYRLCPLYNGPSRRSVRAMPLGR